MGFSATVLHAPPELLSSGGAAVSAPTGAGFDVVLILHVGCVLVSLASVFVTGIQAWRAREGPESPGAQSVARYFQPGINWPGRAVYLVLVLGIALVAMSDKAYSYEDPFVQIGLVLWILSAFAAELVVWPGERQIQRIVSAWPAPRSVPQETGRPQDTGRRGGVSDPLGRVASRVAVSAWAVCAVIIAAVVIMVQKP